MRNKFFQVILFGVIFLSPVFAEAAVRINEVAWMGTTSSQYEEWIELYNDGTAQSLDGWKIYKAGGSTNLISLTGTIGAGQYFLVCRTTPSVTNPLSGACNVSGTFGGSGLNNTSEHIILKDDSSASVDSVDATSGWPAGDSASKQTMQWSGSWITAAGTPGASNATVDSGNENNENENNNEEEEEEDDGNSITTKSTTTTTNNASKSSVKIYSTRIMTLEAPKLMTAGSPSHFKAQALDYDRSKLFKGRYVWNMGDGVVKEMAAGFEKTDKGFDYIYEYPGTYSVSVKYYHSFFEGVPADVVENFTIEVITPTLAISKIYPDGAIEVKNSSGNLLDISGWQLKDALGSAFIIPGDTFLAPNKTIAFSAKVTKLNSFSGINIYTPTGALASAGQVNNSSSPVAKTSSVKKKPVEPVAAEATTGEVLGVQTKLDESSVEKDKSHTFVYILAFAGLVIVAVIAVMFLRKEEKTDDGYELIEE